MQAVERCPEKGEGGKKKTGPPFYLHPKKRGEKRGGREGIGLQKRETLERGGREGGGDPDCGVGGNSSRKERGKEKKRKGAPDRGPSGEGGGKKKRRGQADFCRRNRERKKKKIASKS